MVCLKKTYSYRGGGITVRLEIVQWLVTNDPTIEVAPFFACNPANMQEAIRVDAVFTEDISLGTYDCLYTNNNIQQEGKFVLTDFYYYRVAYRSWVSGKLMY